MNGINHNGSIDYQTLTELSEINSIASEWDALLERCRCNRAFSCSKWFLTTPELFPELSPLVLVARRDGAIAGVMPLMLDPHDRTARSRYYIREQAQVRQLLDAGFHQVQTLAIDGGPTNSASRASDYFIYYVARKK